jgi:hypothetical protein
MKLINYLILSLLITSVGIACGGGDAAPAPVATTAPAPKATAVPKPKATTVPPTATPTPEPTPNASLNSGLISYFRGDPGEIWTVNTDGTSNSVNVANLGISCCSLDWSTDHQKYVFNKYDTANNWPGTFTPWTLTEPV